jgi:hypothetical protein
MKTILRLTAVSMALALSGAIACGGSSSGCGGTSTSNNSSSAPTVTCGAGTIQQGGQCVPVGNVQTN